MTRLVRLAAVLSGVVVLGLGGCTVGPDFKAPKLDLPARFSEQHDTGDSAAATAEVAQWWKSFNDPVLDRLIDEAIAGNLDLQVARQRLIAAREERVQVHAAARPSVGLIAEAQRARASTTVTYPPGLGSYHAYDVGFDASWELDIFGENRRSTEAADYGIGASIDDRRALLVSLLSEVAEDYAALRSAEVEFSIGEANVDTAQRALGYAQRLARNGLGTTLAIAEARAQFENSRAQLPAIKARQRVATHALAVLLGHTPEGFEAEAGEPSPLRVGERTIPATVPAEVIENRPDVHAALMRYAAANARIGVAIAAKLPHISIPMLLTPQASSLGDLFDGASLTYSLALQAAQPLYAGGRLNSRVREARADAEAARLQYKALVLSALQQVEDSLVHVQTDREAQGALRASLDAAQSALAQSNRLYRAGLTDFLTVLTNERTVFAARDAVLQNDLALTTDTIALYKAFGGGWRDIVLDPPIAAAASLDAKAR